MKLLNLFTILRRELAAYFNSAVAYIFIIVFVLLNGGLYMTQFFLINRADIRPFFVTLPFLLAVFMPAATMRLWAEERKGNTLELLLTFPMSTHELVMGKFLGCFIFYLAALAGTFSIPLMTQILGHPDLGAMIGGYIGAALLGAFFIAVGIFISGLCRDQIVAFIMAMLVCFGLYLLGTEFMAASIDGWVPGLGSMLQRFAGVGAHYDAFAKGVIDNRDVIYYLIGTVLFLVLNGFWLEGRMRPKAKTIFTTACLISVAIFFVGNLLLSNLPLGRFDISEGKIYTISPATRTILSGLKSQVTAKLYISTSDKMPTGMKTLEQDIVDKLDELRIASGGKLQYKIFHMEAANVQARGKSQAGGETMEEEISKKGIQPFQVQSIEADEVGLKLIYASLSLAYKEKPEELIPRVMPDNLPELEYLVVSKVFRMTLPSIPRVAMVAPYDERAVDPQLMSILAQLGGGQLPESFRDDNYEFISRALEYEGYEVERIRLTEDETIPKGVKTLAILEPRELNERQRYEISRFLAGGGSVFLAVQNYEYDYTPQGRTLRATPISKNPDINPLLKEWGFEIDSDILLDLQSEVISINGMSDLGPFAIPVPVKLPTQIVLTPKEMNQNISITSRLSSLFYLWGSGLKMDDAKIKERNLKVTPLLHSSPKSWTVPFGAAPVGLDQLKPTDGGKRGPFTLAVMAEGQFPDLYRGKDIPLWPSAETPENSQDIKQTEKAPEISLVPGKLILMGAATPFQKQLIRGGGHANLFLNAIDVLTLGDELVGIRSKQPIDRSLGVISTPAKVFWRFFVTLLIPLLIASAGAFKVFFRNQAKQNYLKTLTSTV